MTLTKKDLTDNLLMFQHLGLTHREAESIVNSVFEVMKETLEDGEDVLITNFGKWMVKEKKERKGRNPQTGEEMLIGERRVVTFKTSGKLKDRLNGRG